MEIYHNGIDFETGAYFRAPLSREEWFAQLKERHKNPFLLKLGTPKGLPPWCDPTCLEQTGWGLLYHEREDPAVIEALEPLIRHREKCCQAPVRRYVIQDQDLEQPLAFMRRAGLARDIVQVEQAPYYLLLVGEPNLISFEFQYELQLSHAVGRLGFDRPEDYAAYAGQLVETENQEPQRRAVMRLFGTINDPLTRLSSHHLVDNLAATLRKSATDWQIETLTGKAASRNAFAACLRESSDALLFVVSHGVSTRHPIYRETVQGAFIGSDWQGPGSPLTREALFCAEDLEQASNLRGSLLFHFGCFTAGAPAKSPFEHAEFLALKPILSALPKRLLALSQGPLAFVGHIDSAASSSFLWEQQIQETLHFSSCFYELMQGKPIGHALSAFQRRFMRIASQITAAAINGEPWEELLPRFRIDYFDARGFALLGDPAVKLRPGKEP